ncbi:Vacuolar morphogenesis protein 6 [Dimargaris cristalligena]|nr:Vacuolar morphogenesis protein 6 [Dimargaris cristalligena]
MHDAFAVLPVIEQLPLKVASTLAHGDRFLIGTDTGVLLVYTVKDVPPSEPSVSVDSNAKVTDQAKPSNTTDGGGSSAWDPFSFDTGLVPTATDYTSFIPAEITLELVEVKKNFTRRTIEQLDVIKEAGLLVVLSDGYVHLFDLAILSHNTQLQNTRGATALAVHTGIEMGQSPSEGIPTLVSRIAVAVRRKILVFTWKDAEYVTMKEYPTPHQVRVLGWATPDQLCIGFGRAEYYLLRTTTGTIGPLLPGEMGAFTTTSNASVFSSATSSIGKWGSMGFNVFSNMALGGSAASTAVASAGAGSLDDPQGPAPPGSDTLIAKLPNDEILVNRDQHTLCIAVKGDRPTRKSDLLWTTGPQAIGYAYPYVVAVSGRQVEIRNLDTSALVQQLALPLAAQRISSGKYLYLAGPHTVWRLMPLPHQIQIAQLLQRHEFVEALSFIDQSDSILVDTKAEYSQCIRFLYAHYLCWTHDYEDSLTLFQDLEIIPSEVVQVFAQGLDEFLAGERLDRPASPASNREVSEVRNGDGENEGGVEENSKDDIVEPLATPPPTTTVADGRDSTDSPSALAHNNVNRPASRQSQSSGLSAALAEQKLGDRVSLLVGYLTEQRRLIAQAVSRKQPTLEFHTRSIYPTPQSTPSPLENYLTQYIPFRLAAIPVPIPPLAQLIDTTLLKAYLMTNPRLVGPLVRVHHNACEIEISERLLLNHHMYQELVDLYFGKGLHRKALHLLHQTATDPDTLTDVPSALAGPFATIQYLEKLSLQHVDLILEYATWIMTSDPDEGIFIFADENRPAMAYLKSPVERIAQYLQKFGDEWAIKYLEFIRTFALEAYEQELKDHLDAQTQTSSAQPLGPGEADATSSSYAHRSQMPPERKLAATTGATSGNFPPLWRLSRSPPATPSGPAIPVLDQAVQALYPVVDHNLACLYLDRVLQLPSLATPLVNEPEGMDSTTTDDPTLSIRWRLRAFLRKSQYYNPERLLGRLPVQGLDQERALVLSRMGRHEQALEIIVYQLHDFAQAETYCNEQSEVPDIYLILLRIYLQPSNSNYANTSITATDEPHLVISPNADEQTQGSPRVSSPSMARLFLTQAIRHMSQYGRHMDTLAALTLIPAALPVHKLYPFFEQSLRTFSHDRQTQRIVRNLMVAERVQVQAQWARIRQQRVAISPDRICPLCYKRIGNTVFVQEAAADAEWSDPSSSGEDRSGEGLQANSGVGVSTNTVSFLDENGVQSGGRKPEPTVVHLSCHQRRIRQMGLTA